MSTQVAYQQDIKNVFLKSDYNQSNLNKDSSDEKSKAISSSINSVDIQIPTV
jgi:hypothetical protein